MNDRANTVDTESLLQDAVKRLVASAPVEKVILFGSRARGDYVEGSDFDICVILNDNVPAGIFTPLSLWKVVSMVDLSIQITAIRKAMFEAEKHKINSISYDIDHDGRVIYENLAPSLSP